MLNIIPIVEEINKCSREAIEMYDETPPCLCVIQVGEDPASNTYVRNKTKVCESVGITVKTVKLAFETSQKTLNTFIQHMNSDDEIDAILLQLPLPSHLNEREAVNMISPYKDVDCLTDVNQSRLIGLDEKDHFNPDRIAPCTPSGILAVMASTGILEDNPHVVIINRSKLVGLPLANILLAKGIDATVTVCHSKTKNLAEICKSADVIVIAVGKPNFLTADMVKPDAVVFDVGINNVNGYICGDVNVASVSAKTPFITPVPGGVGRLTTAALANNTVALWALKHDRRKRSSQDM